MKPLQSKDSRIAPVIEVDEELESLAENDSSSFFDANLDLATPDSIQKTSSYAESVESADGVHYESCAQQIFSGLNLGQTETLDT